MEDKIAASARVNHGAHRNSTGVFHRHHRTVKATTSRVTSHGPAVWMRGRIQSCNEAVFPISPTNSVPSRDTRACPSLFQFKCRSAPVPWWELQEHQHATTSPKLARPSCKRSTFHAAQSGQHCLICLVKQSVCSTA